MAAAGPECALPDPPLNPKRPVCRFAGECRIGIDTFRGRNQMDENTVRQKARDAIAAGKLPIRRPERMWGGPGTGAACAICAQPLKPDQMGFELEFSRHTGAPAAVNYHTHVQCFAAWEFERDNLDESSRTVGEPTVLAADSSAAGGTAESASGALVSAHMLPAAPIEGTIAHRERERTYRRGSA
jgi:hypothetical protein